MLFFGGASAVSCLAMPEMPESGLREVDPGNRDLAFNWVSNLLECTRREIDGVYEWAGRTVIAARQR